MKSPLPYSVASECEEAAVRPRLGNILQRVLLANRDPVSLELGTFLAVIQLCWQKNGIMKIVSCDLLADVAGAEKGVERIRKTHLEDQGKRVRSLCRTP